MNLTALDDRERAARLVQCFAQPRPAVDPEEHRPEARGAGPVGDGVDVPDLAHDGQLVAVEVAGFGSLESNLTHPVDTDEIEENPTDFTQGEDYTYLTAMRAPRPTLLIHNAEDDCCFRAALVKPYIYDQVRPFFRLLGHEEALAW